MALPTTQHRPGPRPANAADERRGATPGSPVRGVVSMGVGAASVVVAVLPSLGLLALLLAGAAIAVGVRVMRRGARSAAFPFARLGVVLGMIGVLLGFLSLGMQLLD